MKIYLLRHGQRGHGNQQDILTEIGKEQARRTAEFLKNIKFDKVICGAKNRARNTLKPLLTYCNCEIEYTNEVNERELGVFEGKSSKEWGAALEEAGFSEEEFRPENGENRKDVLDRVKRFYDRLKKESVNNLLVVSHAGFISDLITFLLNLPEYENIHFKTGFCALSYFELDSDFKVIDFSIGELKHLACL